MRTLAMIIMLPAALWAAGFLAYSAEINRQPPSTTEGFDGIVVFTGGKERVSSALNLFDEGVGTRLLISGVHPETTREDIAEFWHGSDEKFDCCVDLGLEAQTTEGNAKELRDWSKTHAFQKVLLISSDYHIPRAMIEAKRYAPNISITPYPIKTQRSGFTKFKYRFNHVRNLAGEYTKYALARVRSIVG